MPRFLLRHLLSLQRSHLLASDLPASPSRRSLSRQANLLSRITDEQMNDLVLKLQAILPEARVGGNDKVSTGKVLQETCCYIRSLHREMDDLSERLTELLSATDISSVQATSSRVY